MLSMWLSLVRNIAFDTNCAMALTFFLPGPEALKSKQNAEKDKETLAYIINKFLVRDTDCLSITHSLSAMQMAGIVNATVCRERLEMALVANVGLIADKAAFEKKEIRTRTGLL